VQGCPHPLPALAPQTDSLAFAIIEPNGGLFLEVNNGWCATFPTSTSPNTAAADGNWHLIAASWTAASTAATLYMDGVVEGVFACSNSAIGSSTGCLVVGQESDGTCSLTTGFSFPFDSPSKFAYVGLVRLFCFTCMDPRQNKIPRSQFVLLLAGCGLAWCRARAFAR
jgi:hypothetical protein